MELQKKLQNSFSDLMFIGDTHTYTLDGVELESTSLRLKDFYKPFDSKRIAPFVAKKRGISTEEILQEWEDIRNESATKGSKFHDWAEHWVPIRKIKSRKLEKNTLDHMQLNCIDFWDNLDSKYEVAALELRMYHPLYNYAGTADIILYNTETGKYILGDYKTNRDLHKNYKGQTLKMPFQELLDNPLNKYALQLAHYQMMLEYQGFEIEERWIIHVNDQEGYKIYKTEDHTSKLIEYYEHKELFDWLS